MRSPARLTATPNDNDNGGAANDATRRLLEKASALRAELARLENKPLAQVEEESRARRADNKRVTESATTTTTPKTNNPTTEETEEARRRRISQQSVSVPESFEDQVRQAARAVERATEDGLVRQVVRMALLRPEDVVSGEPGEWPGGAQEMYRESMRPLTESLLREIRLGFGDDDGNAMAMVPTTITAQDVWDFDGSARIEALPNGPRALVFPNTDVKYLGDIEAEEARIVAENHKEGGGPKRPFLLMNPFWRDVESWSFNILAPKGKARAQKILFDEPAYVETYVLRRFSVRGEKCVALKVYPYDWQLFAYLEEPMYNGLFLETPIRLGSSPTEPNATAFVKGLSEREEFKYNRNMRQLYRGQL